MLTAAELDEALDHLREVAHADRGSAWYAYLDDILDQAATVNGIRVGERGAEMFTPGT